MNAEEIAILLEKQQGLAVPKALAQKLTRYLHLLLRWNARTNLSAIRAPEEIVLRHFGESLVCARALPPAARSVLDYGSGAGFPGAVIALARPELAVTLAESQGKKAAFLRELGRTLEANFVVHSGRVAELPKAARFDVVTLRAVDRMADACLEATVRIHPGGALVWMTSQGQALELRAGLGNLHWGDPVPLPGTREGVIEIGFVPLANRT